MSQLSEEQLDLLCDMLPDHPKNPKGGVPPPTGATP